MPSLAFAQAAPATDQDVPVSNEEPIALEEFTVPGSSGNNTWAATNTLSGTRTNIALQDLPRSVQVLTSEFLDDIGATGIADAGEFLAGVEPTGTADSVFDANSFNIRGMGTNRNYRDGTREATPGMVNDSATIDRVEVLLGPASLLVGVSDPGGVLNQSSKRPTRTQKVALRGTVGSWNYYRTQADVSVPLNRKLAVRAVAAYQNSDSWRDFEGNKRKVGYVATNYRFNSSTSLDARFEVIDAHNVLSLAKGGWVAPKADGTVSTNRTATSEPGGLPDWLLPFDFNPNGPNSFRDVRTYRAGVEFQQRINPTFSLRAAMNWSSSNTLENRVSANASTVYTRKDTNGNIVPEVMYWGATLNNDVYRSWTGQVDFRGKFKYASSIEHEAILSVELIQMEHYQDRKDTPTGVPGTGGADHSTPNALTFYRFPTSLNNPVRDGGWQSAWTEMQDRSRYTVPNIYTDQTNKRFAVSQVNLINMLNRKIHIMGGMRYDFGSYHVLSGASRDTAIWLDDEMPNEHQWTGSAGILYRPVRPLSLYTSYSTSFAGIPNGLTVDNKPLTKPESAKSIEAGFKTSFWDDKLSFSGAIYKLERTNARVQVYFPSTDGESGNRYAQYGQTKVNPGMEANIVAKPFEGYQILVNYTFTDAQIVQDRPDRPSLAGSPVPNVGRHSGSIVQKYRFRSGALKGLSANAAVRLVEKRVASLNTTRNADGTAAPGYGDVKTYTPGYGRLDLGVSYEFKLMRSRVTLTARCRNVLDRQYMAGPQSKAPPRSYQFTTDVKF